MSDHAPAPLLSEVRRRQAGPVQLMLLLAGSCLPVLGAVLISPVLPQMTRDFAGTPAVDILVPVVLTVPALMIGLSAPFAGVVIDSLDRKRLLLIAMLVYALFGTAPLYLDSLGAIVASRVVVGVAEAAILTCCTTLISDYWSGPTRARYLGLQVLVAAVSATLFFGIGGALGAGGWRVPFWLYAVALVLAVPMARFLWQPDREERDDASAAEGLEDLPLRSLLTPVLLTLVGGVVFYALIVQLPFVLDDAGVTSTGTIGIISALMSAATAAGAITFGRLTQVAPMRLLFADFGISAVGLVIVFGAGDNIAAITLGAVVTGFGTGLLLPTLLVWFVSGLTFGQRGRGTGIFTGSLFVGEFTSPLILAAVGAGLGGLRPALGLLGIAAAATAAVVGMRSRTPSP